MIKTTSLTLTGNKEDEIELPLIEVLSYIERNGAYIDAGKLRAQSDRHVPRGKNQEQSQSKSQSAT